MNRLYYAANYKEWKAKRQVYDNILDIINSLQQEQPKVDIEKEIDEYLEPIEVWQIQEAPYALMRNIARHFYELGLKVRKEN